MRLNRPSLATRALASPLGALSARESLTLEALTYLYRTLTLTLDVRADRTPEGRPPRARWRVTFRDVEYFNTTTLDANVVEKSLASSLSEVDPSDWCAANPRWASHRHFIVAAYDEVIEVIARGCEFEPLSDGGRGPAAPGLA